MESGNIDDYADLPRRTMDSVDVGKLEKKYIDEILKFYEEKPKTLRKVLLGMVAVTGTAASIILYGDEIQNNFAPTPTVESTPAPIAETPVPTIESTLEPDSTQEENPVADISRLLVIDGNILGWKGQPGGEMHEIDDSSDHWGDDDPLYAIWKDENSVAMITDDGNARRVYLIEGEDRTLLFQTTGKIDSLVWTGFNLWTTYTNWEQEDVSWYLVDALTGVHHYMGDGDEPERLLYQAPLLATLREKDYSTRLTIYSNQVGKSQDVCTFYYDQTVWPYELVDPC